ncbi:MAG TPA: transglycosylase SLT domain-containing protein, partial [Tahibacter sp.]|nr:transglycosylase SLT domain-containing protein [Tahibacter sp.]
MGPKTKEATAAAIVRGRVAADPSTQAVALGGTVPQVKPTPAGNIQADAAAAGVPPTVALAIANIESRLNPNADNPNSSAHGLFQLLDSTREQYSPGADRGDVAAQSKAGVAYIADSYKALRQSLGREPQPHEIYMAHLFGQAGSQAILKAPD